MQGTRCWKNDKEALAYAQINPLLEKQTTLLGEIANLQLSNIDLEASVGAVGGIAKALIPDESVIMDRLKALETPLKEGIAEISNSLANTENPPVLLARIVWDAYYNLKQLEEKKLLMKERLAKFSEDLNNMMDMSKLSSLSNFGSAIGNAIGTGQNVIQAAGASLLGSLGDIMVKYGKLILAFGIASEALKEAMENPFGGGIAAVVAGVALIAIGSAIKGAAGSASSGGGGGGVSGGTSTYSPSSTSSGGGSSSSALQNVVFEIQGTKLVGVLSNTLARNRNLGGSLSLT
jgi:hypothetical protein